MEKFILIKKIRQLNGETYFVESYDKRIGIDEADKEVLGVLELNAWYQFNGIRNDYAIFLYIDKEGNTHTFEEDITKGLGKINYPRLD